MSRKSNKSVPKASEGPLDRPFDPGILSKARALAARYRILLETDEGVGFVGSAVEMPYVFADGLTPDACVAETREALAGVIAHQLEKGQPPPTPASQQKREEQVNVRLTAQEKLRLEEAARSKGFRGLSDYMRNAALAHTD